MSEMSENERRSGEVYKEKEGRERKRGPTCVSKRRETEQNEAPKQTRGRSTLRSESLSDSLFGHLVNTVEEEGEDDGQHGARDEEGDERRDWNERVGSHDSHELDLIGNRLEN